MIRRPAEIIETFYASDRLDQAKMNWLARQTVSVKAMIDPDPILSGRIVTTGSFFDIVNPDEEGVRALLFLARDSLGDPVDIVAWQPRTGSISTWLANVAVLGADRLYDPRLETDGALPVWRSPLGWLRNCRGGVVVVDMAKASASLADAGPLLAEDVEHGLELRKSLAPPAPRILFHAPGKVAA